MLPTNRIHPDCAIWLVAVFLTLSRSPLLWAGEPLSRTVASPAAACQTLANLDFSGIDEAPTQLLGAQLVESKSGVSGYCEVQGYILPQVGIELRLPNVWNGKFIEIGSGGEGGDFNFVRWCPTNRGYACIFSDMGHTGRGGLWAVNNLQAQIDYGYRAAHVAAVAGKAITARYYGRAPRYSYFHGCSTGARQGLVEAQRFPWDFDGVIVGGVWVDDISTMNFIWGSRALKDEEGKPLLSADNIRTIHEAVLAKCDLDDGVKDGLISHPLGRDTALQDGGEGGVLNRYTSRSRQEDL
jgi:hypothetical protein